MKKAEAEKTVRYLCHEWRRAEGFSDTPDAQLSAYSFMRWLRANHSYCLDFRAQTSVEFEIERWFDDEFGLNWMR